MAESDTIKIPADIVPVSPFDSLESQSLSGDGIHIAPLPYCIKLNLRGDPTDTGFVGAVESFCALALPVKPNSVSFDASSSLFWLGPDEWQWRISANNEAAAEDLVARFRVAMRGIASSIVDVSDYYSIVRLTGERVHDVLAKGTPLDTRRSLATPDTCAQTRYGHASVLLSKVSVDGGELTVDMQMRWSFTEYIWLYLSESVREFQD